MTKLTIKITKDVLRQSMYCETANGTNEQCKTGQNCAIGRAICELFPNSWVGEEDISFYPDKLDYDYEGVLTSKEFATTCLPSSAVHFIKTFDRATPEQRLLLPEFSFDIEIPDEVVDTISIDEIKRIVQGSKTLELV